MIAHVLTALAAQAAFAAAGPSVSKRASAAAYCSSSDSTYQLSSIAAPVQGAGSPGSEGTWQLTFDDTSSGYKQTVDGFGACVTDATVAVFDTLSSSSLSTLLDNLMTSAGVSFSFLRHTIASSDLSADPAYTYDDNSGNPDPNLTGFNLGNRGNSMAALLAQMKNLNSGLKILGTPWSAPGWMKLNGVIDGTTVNNNLNDNNGPAFAEYFVKYLQAYQSAGVTIDAITIQNEPLNSNAGFPTMYVYAAESGDLIQNNVGPALKDAGLGTEIWAYDHNTDVPSYPATVLSEAGDYVNTVAWHCYAPNNNWDVLTEFHDNYTDVTQYMTECWTSPSTPWSQAADFTMGPLQNWASGVAAWTLGTDSSYGPHLSGSGPCDTCRGLVTVDNGEVTYQIDYYMLGQFSKFIPQGAIVVSGTGSYTYSDGTGVQAVATVNPDGSRTVVMTNKLTSDIYITATLQSGTQWSGNVPTNSVVTWVLPA